MRLLLIWFSLVCLLDTVSGGSLNEQGEAGNSLSRTNASTGNHRAESAVENKKLSLPLSPEAKVKPSSLLALTAQEQAYLDSKPYLSVMTLSKFHPFSFQQGGEPLGYSVEFMRLMSELLDKEFRFITDKTWKEQLDMLKQGDLDIIPHIVVTEERRSYVEYTDFLHLTYLIGFVTHKGELLQSMDDLAGKTVAVVDRYYLHDHLKKHFPQIPLLLTQSTQESIDALANHQAYATVDNLTTLNYFIRQRWLNQLQVSSVPDFGLPTESGLHMGVAKGNLLLKSILEKANAAVPKDKVAALQQKWFSTQNNLYQSFTEEEKNYLRHKPYLSVMSLENFQPFSFRHNGVPTGYSVETMQLMGKMLGKEIRFVKKPWNEQLEMLKKGQLDVIPHLAVTEQRKTFADYTDFIHLTYLIGFAITKDHQLHSMADFKDKTLAVVKGYYLYDHLKKNFPNIALLPAQSTQEAVQAVAQGKAFAVVDNIPTLNYFIQEKWLSNLKIATVNDFGLPLQTQMPMGITKGNQVLKSILEKVHAELPAQELAELKKRWFNSQNAEAQSMALNQQEKAFLRQHEPIRFRIRKNRPPFEFVEEGKAVGIAVDYLTAISEKVGMQVEFVLDDRPLDEAFAMISGTREDYDTLAFLVKSPERMEKFIFGEAFLSYPMMIVTHKDSGYLNNTAALNGKTVAVEKGFLTEKWLRRDYPQIQLVEVQSTKAALQLVDDGGVDAYIGNLSIANYMIAQGELENIKIMAPTDYGNIYYHFIAPKPWPELVSILNKGYHQLSPNEHSSINQKWFSMQVIEKFNYELFWQILGLILFFVIWVVWWNRKIAHSKKETELALVKLQEAQELLENKNQELEILSVTDRLTGLYNRAKLDRVMERELARANRYGETFGIILLDIDHFKLVNDNFGHRVGDELLVDFAQILQQNIRTIDTVGRWGGEEFMIICPNTDKQGTMTLAEHLKQSLSEHPFPEVGHKTASFGVTTFEAGDREENLLTRADKGLYQAKESGRNRVIFCAP